MTDHNYLVIKQSRYLYLKEPIELFWCENLDDALELAQDLAADTGEAHIVLSRFTVISSPASTIVFSGLTHSKEDIPNA